MAVIALVGGMTFFSLPLSGNGGHSCPCGGACNHAVMRGKISSGFLPPLLAVDSVSEALIISSLAVRDVINCAANWCMNLIYEVLDKLKQWHRSFDRYALTGYWQELDCCPVCRDQKTDQIIKYGLVNSPHQAFAMLLAWLKDQRISRQAARDYFECMNTDFPVLKLLTPVLSGEYQFEARGYPIIYLSAIINGFSRAVPYQTIIFTDNQFGHMVGVLPGWQATFFSLFRQHQPTG